MPKSTTTVKRWWIAILILAIFIQAGLRVAQGAGYLISVYLMMLAVSVVYCCRCCRNNSDQHQQEENPQEATAAAVQVPPAAVIVEEEPTTSSSLAEGQVQMQQVQIEEEVPQDVEGCSNQQEPKMDSHDEQAPPPTRPRLYFLDNIKIFLTLMVLWHHVSCAFGGCGSGGQQIVVGDYSNPFGWILKSFVELNQGYFMPMFFFISAYFTPTSYDRKGQDIFLADKRKRLWIPAMVNSFVLVPISLMIATLIADNESDLGYLPMPWHCWFLFWLLIFNFCYSTLRESVPLVLPAAAAAAASQDTDDVDDPTTSSPFPSPRERFWYYGVFVCGIGMLILAVIIGGYFAGMPIATGSFTCDVLFFCAGVLAARNGWLYPNLTEKLGMSVWTLRCRALLEGAVLVTLRFLIETEELLFIPYFIVGGVYCVDMSLVVLQFFQQYLDFQTPFTKFLSEAAYGVYIVHPLVITGASGIFVTVYNNMFDDVIVFEESDMYSESMLKGPGDGALHLFIGFLCVFVVSHLICWPLAWWIRRLPGFKQVL